MKAVAAPGPLARLLRRQPEAQAVVRAMTEVLGGPVAILDPDGAVLHGDAPAADAERVPVTVDGDTLAWVAAPRHAGALASLLAYLARQQTEHKALGAEVLHLYRELNLIYSFSEKLAAQLETERVAGLTLEEARRLIPATDGLVLLLDEDGTLRPIASFGDSVPAGVGFRRGEGIVGAVAATGRGEIVNDVRSDPRPSVQTPLQALLCAPMQVGERTIGVIAIGRAEPGTYAAADLKLLNTLALQAATAIENARLFERTVEAARERERLLELHQAAELARARLENELELAARIQSQLFPAELPAVPGYELAARNRPARQCGGDYYDVLPGPSGDGRLLLCVADVAGKGLPAALVMSGMQATLRALQGHIAPLSALAGRTSELLYGSTSPEKYVTAALVELAPATGELTFVGAGHLDNVIVQPDGQVMRLSSTGLPLGLLPLSAPYDAATAQLSPGDILLLYSDGATEARNGSGEEFGEQRLLDAVRQVVHRPADAIVDAVLESLDAFVGGAPQFDDVTLLAVRRLPAQHP
ncbi:MAG TPA: GAF domain-containing SpoIIE family protein phosphatase [Vicinamibacterales bacterium]